MQTVQTLKEILKLLQEMAVKTKDLMDLVRNLEMKFREEKGKAE